MLTLGVIALLLAAASCHSWNRKPDQATSDCLAQCPPERSAVRSEQLGPETRSECEKHCYDTHNR